MISFITGKPGDGKTLFAVRQLLEDLVNTEIFVVTNIPLNIKKVYVYVSEKRGDRRLPFVIDDRLKVIPDVEVYEFYRHRSGGLVLGWSPDKTAGEDGLKRIDRPAFVAAMKKEFNEITKNPEYQKPVNYYIDEAHNFFSSREWATNGRGLLYYASQHRHLWDNIFLITQVMENVEKQLRSLVSETHSCRNQLRRRIGPVQMRPIFRVKGYYGSDMKAQPFANTVFKLDPSAVAGCYKTVGALGVHDTPESLPKKAPLPWWCLPVGGVLLALVVGLSLVALPMLGGRAGRLIVNGSFSPDSPAKVNSPASSRPRDVVGASTVSPASSRQASASVVVAPWPTGYVAAGRRVCVQMSDSTWRIERDAELTNVERNSITLNGEKLFFRPAARPGRAEWSGNEAAPVAQPVPIITTADASGQIGQIVDGSGFGGFGSARVSPAFSPGVTPTRRRISPASAQYFQE
jgi:Zonular occludens toxin (Zot)